MFRKSPYYGWLLTVIVSWYILLWHEHQQEQIHHSQSLATIIGNDLCQRENSFQKLLKDTAQIHRIFENNLSSKEVNELEQQPFLLYAFQDNELIFWNNNSVVGTCNNDALLNQTSLLSNNGVYLKKCLDFHNNKQTLVVLFPILYKYPFENKYLVSHLAADENISSEISIAENESRGDIAVKGLNQKPAFFITNNHQISFSSNSKTTIFLLLSILLSIVWLTLIAVDLSRRKSSFIGFGILLITVLFVCGIVYLIGLPFQLGNTLLFSPGLYASSNILSSLGYLLFYLIASFWLLSFLLLQKNEKPEKKLLQGFYLIVTSIAIGILCFLPLELIRSLVLDSSISFDVTHFYSISAYTVLGLFCILLIAALAVVALYLVRSFQNKVLSTTTSRVVHFLISILLAFFFVDKSNHVQFGYGVLWFVVFALALNLVLQLKNKKYFSSLLAILVVFVLISITSTLLVYTHQKKETEHHSFAERIANQRDNMMEFLFEDIANNLQQDKWLQSYLDSPQIDTRLLIDEHITNAYFSGTLNRFDAKFLLFNKEEKPVFNSDTSSFVTVENKIHNADSVANFLFHKESKKDNEAYCSFIPISKDNTDTIGFLYIDLKQKSGKQETVYPELLQPENFTDNRTKENIAYAVYLHQELKSQIGNYFFPVFLNNKQFGKERYQIDAEKTVVIVDNNNRLIEAVTLFSYLLGIFIFCALLFVFIRYFLLFTFNNQQRSQLHLSLQKRIQYSMLTLVVVAFLIIGSVTISFFVRQSKQSNKIKLQESMQVAERTIQQYFVDSKIIPDAYSFDKVTESASFKNFISRLVEEHGIDINIYNKFGSLNATSQEGIYNKSILARIMMPVAYYKLSQNGNNSIVMEEKIGRLQYLSSYLAIQTELGETIGYINIPYFSSQKELSYHISTLVVALIDLFALIFLISGLFTVVITRWLTSKLQMIIEKFKGFNLQANELLVWPYEDEIGLLVNEYNKMVKKVEEQAHLLSKTERETAWREMAKQVAHEIKNPLTPMKLNVQYLQQAIKTNQPNTEQLVSRVSQSMIEQIDNLTHIASAFSDFAKMPEAAPENIELNDFFIKATEIYKNQIELRLDFQTDGIKVLIDKSQLLRVVTNLVQNAIEAIPENRKGRMDISLKIENENAIITIKDNGSGIPDSVIEHIFNPYFTTKSSGTGLGLAMTKRIVEFWNGKIWFETNNDGTAFFIEFPKG